ncbi:uncharacterized protein LOC9654414 [Selaginella moellendorffii]|uniref:uncharacterized protein LOC9654414 n=1 Tax=Selaginella moellendorffii TaxID=88036 RepID=UPI000D1CAD50|nr:uncharacterized protein LOC9654414 [Selaginella moellendorffii]|eukprot:XP_024524875.1 uncharacterized protein LOC9654414 [Selaginella moellendorffii]
MRVTGKMRRARDLAVCSRIFSTIPSVDAIPSEIPVVIVGGGPVGITLSILLSKLGVQSLLVEKRCKLPDHPQAHFINNRTMEIFRRLDGLGSKIEALQPPLDHWRRFTYCTALDGLVLGVVDHIHPKDLTSNRSPTNVAHFSQHRLLPILVENATKSGVSLDPISLQPNQSSIFMGYQCDSIRSSLDKVVATLRPTGSTASEKIVTCQYLVAADGAGSGVRKSMGVTLQGQHNLQQLISVHFISEKLSKYLVDNRPGMLFFVFNPSAIAVIVAHDLRLGEFVAQMPFYPPQQNADDFTESECQKTIRQLLSLDIDVEVKSVKPWVMHAEVAEKCLCGEGGRVILAGDAAHRFPPAGGFGMNTGIQDAHNLAWKLAAVLNSMAPPTLLETYETERRPIAEANTALSVENFKAAMSIPSALGLDPSYARMVHETINSTVGSILPKSLQSQVLDGIFSVGRAQVASVFLNRYNPVAQARISHVKKILEQGKSLQLQFPAEDLLFRYTNGALVPEDNVEESSRERQREYVPLSVPGVRLPHMKIKVLHGGSPGSEDISSTLDLIHPSRLEFLFLVECSASGLNWAEDALQLSKSSPFPLRVVVLSDQTARDAEADFVGSWKERNAGAYTEVVAADKCNWWELCGVSQPGIVILVRPDDHIAWRSSKQHGSKSFEELRLAFDSVLGWNEKLQLKSAGCK